MIDWKDVDQITKRKIRTAVSQGASVEQLHIGAEFRGAAVQYAQAQLRLMSRLSIACLVVVAVRLAIAVFAPDSMSGVTEEIAARIAEAAAFGLLVSMILQYLFRRAIKRNGG